MRILSLDSSTPGCSVALLNNDSIVSESIAEPRPSYSQHLLQMVDDVLKRANVRLPEVNGFAMTIGPGSFTGLRVGVSLIKGFVLATEKPFVAVDSLEALATTRPRASHPVCPVLDARKQEVYAAVYEWQEDTLSKTLEEGAYAPESLCRHIQRPTLLIGPGVERYREVFENRLGHRFLEAGEKAEFSTAAGAAFIAARRFDEHRQFDLNSLQINYIRKSEAQLSLGRPESERRSNHGY